MPPVSTTRSVLPGPFGFAIEAVARDARLVADDGAARADQPVEQRGLADVRSADDGQRASHQSFPVTTCVAGFELDATAHSDSFGGGGPNGYYRYTSLSHRVFRLTIRHHCGALAIAVPVLRAGRRTGTHPSRVRVSPRTTADGRGRRAGADGAPTPDRRSRHRYRQNAGLSVAGHTLRQASHHLDRNQDPAGAAFFQGRPFPAGAPG